MEEFEQRAALAEAKIAALEELVKNGVAVASENNGHEAGEKDRKELEKAQFRIRILLRTLEARDAEIETLKKELEGKEYRINVMKHAMDRNGKE